MHTCGKQKDLKARILSMYYRRLQDAFNLWKTKKAETMIM